jgi:hypothetical protein
LKNENELWPGSFWVARLAHTEVLAVVRINPKLQNHADSGVASTPEVGNAVAINIAHPGQVFF